LFNCNCSNDGVAITFGKLGETRVVGDWNGDGKDTLAVRRGTRFAFRNHNTSGRAEYQSTSYGATTDHAIAGDWNGDGKAGVGLIS
jgi:hypothetical protein